MSDTVFKLEYTGKINSSKPKGKKAVFQKKPVYPYLPSDDLKESVKLAIMLKRPLLLMGEPGCGKTKLATAIAYEFTQNYHDKLQQFDLEEWPLFTWYVKSTSKAKDGVYIYDSISRLRDAQLASSDFISDKEELKAKLSDETHKAYIKYGPLGKALQSPVPAVLLIDEIDKADIDFPNDLLLELDEGRFFITETQTWMPQEAQAAQTPIVLITSNNERPLPDAFLRRCFFHFFEPPTFDQLKQIVHAHFDDFGPEILSPAIVEDIVSSFMKVRRLGQQRAGGKQPGTSELLDWTRALLLLEGVENIPKKLEQFRNLELPNSGTRKEAEKNKASQPKFPYQGALHKTRDEELNANKAIRQQQQEQREQS